MKIIKFTLRRSRKTNSEMLSKRIIETLYCNPFKFEPSRKKKQKQKQKTKQKQKDMVPLTKETGI